MAKNKYDTVAFIYDFDGTLSPDNMQEYGFIKAIGKNADEFWTENARLSKDNDASNILCYMNLMIKMHFLMKVPYMKHLLKNDKKFLII